MSCSRIKRKFKKIWESTCDWLKKNISDIAELAGGAVKSTVDSILVKIRGGMLSDTGKILSAFPLN